APRGSRSFLVRARNVAGRAATSRARPRIDAGRSAEERRVERADGTQRLEERDADGVRQVQRAHGAERGNPHGAIGVGRDELLGETDALLAEDERVAGGEPGAQIALLGLRSEEMEPTPRRLAAERVKEVGEVDVLADVDQVPVVDAGAPHAVL